jgi:ABC-type ATPase involved in cell division
VLLDDVARSGCGVMMATHDARIVDAMQRRVVSLRDGTLVSDAIGRYAGVSA